MVLNKGGYVMINKAQDNVYELATSALTSGKPILWYETNTECYFIDTIKLSGTNIILTKGGKTITIESDGDITENGDVQQHLYKYDIKYSDGGDKIYFSILKSEDIDITTIEEALLETLIGDDKIIASGCYAYDDINYSVVYAVYYDEGFFVLATQPSFELNETINSYVFDGGVPNMVDERILTISSSNTEITKIQLF